MWTSHYVKDLSVPCLGTWCFQVFDYGQPFLLSNFPCQTAGRWENRLGVTTTERWTEATEMEEIHLQKVPVVDRWVNRRSQAREKEISAFDAVWNEVFSHLKKIKHKHRRELELSNYSLQSLPPLRLFDWFSISTCFSLHYKIHKCTMALPFENSAYS